MQKYTQLTYEQRYIEKADYYAEVAKTATENADKDAQVAKDAIAKAD
jgi:hypothetical protein